MSFSPGLRGSSPKLFGVFEKSLLGMCVVSELVRIPLSLLIFNEKWTFQGRFWRRGLFTAFTKYMLRAFKYELVIISTIFLPQIVQYSSVAWGFIVSLKRKIKRRKRNSNRPAENKEDGYYHHCSLDSSDKEIRLLTLYPGIEGDKIHVEVFHASLHDCPQYLALSYVWGVTWNEEPIFINGLQFTVTVNLFQALEKLRNMSGPNFGIPFWIDALCIDQVNDSERGEQVRLMKEIYSSAFKVLVWLAPPSQDSELAMAKMTGLEASSYLWLQKTSQLEGEIDETVQNNDNFSHYHEILIGPSLPSEQLEPWEAIVRILETPWWNRAWIAQEVSSPVSRATPLGNVEIIMGRQLQTVSFLSTVRVLAFIFRLCHDSYVREYGPQPRGTALMETAAKLSFGIDRLAHISNLRNKRTSIVQHIVIILSGKWKNNLYEMKSEQYRWTTQVRPMLALFRGLGCNNPRDKVYAALPLVLPASHPAIAPDYALPIDEVFVQVVRSFIEYEKCLSILTGSSENAEIPSWVPDWRCKAETYELCTRIDTHGNPIYNASGNKLPFCTINTERRENPEKFPHEVSRRWILAAHGFLIDCIVEVSPSPRNSKALHQPEWESIVRRLPENYAPTNEPIQNAYQRVLMTDVYNEKAFYGDEKDATVKQRILNLFESIESDLRKWVSQARKHLPSYSIIHAYESITVPIKHIAWKRGATIEENFFNQPSTESKPVNWTSPSLSAEEKQEAIRKYDNGRRVERLVQSAITNRVLCITEKGYIGLVPYKAQIGDQIVVLFGGYTPFVVREAESVGDEKRWTLLGESYIHGVMDGEAIKSFGMETEKFVLI